MHQIPSSNPTIQSTQSSSPMIIEPSNNLSRPNEQEDSCFDNLVIVERISQAKFSVYLVYSPVTQQHYAMKVYPRELKSPSFFYLNEIRFRRLNHPNVVSIVAWHPHRHFTKRGDLFRLSYILMEFAPYGDLFDFFMRAKDYFDEKLTRTFFHQLMDGLEFLHAHGVAHLDLKLENLLLGENFQLKIADFDLSYVEGDAEVRALGSKCHRAPELLSKTCSNPKAADIYSAGVILFMLQSQGVLPHLEDQLYKGVDLLGLLGSNQKMFWKKHCEFHREKAVSFTNDFRSLFNGMTRSEPKDRLTINEIKGSKWYNGEIYSAEELAEQMERLI